MPRGGKREGAGAKKGSKHAATLSKEQAREALREIVLREMENLTAAQIAHAKGLRYLVVRNKRTGKFERVSKEKLESLLANPEADDELEAIEVWDKEPSTQAFTDLMNRALDKPAEQVQKIELSGSVNLVDRLHAARNRLAKRSPK